MSAVSAAASSRAAAWSRLLMLAILLLAAAARFHRLGVQSLWYDEGIAYAHAQRTLPEIIPLLQRNVHVPAYFTLLGFWEDATGASEFSLRALSAFFSLISVALAYALGARLYHPLAALAAAAFVALNGFSVYYAQEARMYAMLTALSGASMWLLIAVLRARDRSSTLKRALALGLMNALGMYTHVAFALIILTQTLLLLIRLVASPRSRAAIQQFLALLLANALTLLLFSPWLPTALTQVQSQPNIAAAIPPEQLLRTIQGNLIFGSAYQLSLGDLAFAAYVFLIFGLIRPRAAGRAAWTPLLPLIWSLASLSLYLHFDLGERYLRFLLPLQLGIALWLGRGVWILSTLETRHRFRSLRHLPKLAAFCAALALWASMGASLTHLYHHPDFQRDDLRGLAATIESDLRPGDALLVSGPGLQEPLRYYYAGATPIFALPTSNDADETRQQVHDIISHHSRIHALFYGAAEQDPERIVESTLNSAAYEIRDQWIDDLRYVQYASRGQFSAPQRPNQRFGEHITLRAFALASESLEPGDPLLAQLTWSTDAPLTRRYKVFLQLLDAEGVLVAQRDSEPGGGLSATDAWMPGDLQRDNHALLIPHGVPAGDYRLIAGLYDLGDPAARLPVNDGTYLELARIRVG